MKVEVLHSLAAAVSTTTSVGFVINSQYGWVLIVAAVLALEILIIGFLFPGRARAKYFTKEFLTTHFGEEHKKAYGV